MSCPCWLSGVPLLFFHSKCMIMWSLCDIQCSWWKTIWTEALSTQRQNQSQRSIWVVNTETCGWYFEICSLWDLVSKACGFGFLKHPYDETLDTQFVSMWTAFSLNVSLVTCLVQSGNSRPQLLCSVFIRNTRALMLTSVTYKTHLYSG